MNKIKHILLIATILFPIVAYPCKASYRKASDKYMTIQGKIVYSGSPCVVPDGENSEDFPCADCLVPALEANKTIYYLNDIEEKDLSKQNIQIGDSVEVVGTLITIADYHFIEVSSIIKSSANELLPVCNRWNVLVNNRFTLGPTEGEIWTNGFRLQGDTTIGKTTYKKVEFANGKQKHNTDNWQWIYYGALRETNNAEIYFVPGYNDKEFLLCAFNAREGEVIENLFVKRDNMLCRAIVTSVTDTEITYDLEFSDNGTQHAYVVANQKWIRGIGKQYGLFLQYDIYDMDGIMVDELLCAYNDEQLIYTSSKADLYGCEYWEDTTTGLPNISDKNNDAPAYNILGIPVSENYKGIIIRNGHKELKQ